MKPSIECDGDGPTIISLARMFAIGLLVACQPAQPSQVAGAALRTVSYAPGASVVIAPGALPADTAVKVTALSRREFEQALKRNLAADGFTFLGGLLIDTGGVAFQHPIIAAIPNAMNLEAKAQVLIAEVLPEVRGRPALSLVDIATVEPGTVRAGGTKPFNGIHRDGRYAFLWPKKPFEFVAGQVVDAAGAPVEGALIFVGGGTHLIAETDPGNFAAAFRAAPGHAIPVLVVTRGLMASAVVHVPSPPTPGAPRPLLYVPLAENSGTANQVDRFSICDDEELYERVLEEANKAVLSALKDTISSLYKAAREGASPEEGPFQTRPKEIAVSAEAPVAKFAIDFSEYMRGLGRSQFQVKGEFEMHIRANPVRTKIVFEGVIAPQPPIFGAVSQNRDMALASSPVFPPGLREADVSISMALPPKPGVTTVEAFVTTVHTTVTLNYNAKGIDEPSCRLEDQGPDLDPPTSETAHIGSVRVTVLPSNTPPSNEPSAQGPVPGPEFRETWGGRNLRPEDLVIPPRGFAAPRDGSRQQPGRPARGGESPLPQAPFGTQCPGGLLISTLHCTPIGSGGASSYCLTSAEYTRVTGEPLPSACYPQGTTGCMGSSRQGSMTFVKPCCPGLTCRVSSKCGVPDVAGGACMP